MIEVSIPMSLDHQLHNGDTQTELSPSRSRESKRSRGSNGHVKSPLETYLKEIGEAPLLTAGEEKELGQKIRAGDTEARERMIRSNLRLVVGIAHGFLGKGLGLQDLIQEGAPGLMRAVQGFDPEFNTRFSTYATYWIKRSIRQAIADKARNIRLPSYMPSKLARWKKLREELNELFGYEPSFDQIADEFGLKKNRIKQRSLFRQALISSKSTWQDGGPSGEAHIDEMVQDEREAAAEEKIMDAENIGLILEIIDQLDPREAMILRLRYGLADEEPKTLKEIGESVGLTMERVRRIQSEAIGKIQKKLHLSPDNNGQALQAEVRIFAPPTPSMLIHEHQVLLRHRLLILTQVSKFPGPKRKLFLRSKEVNRQQYSHLQYCREAMKTLLEPDLMQKWEFVLGVLQNVQSIATDKINICLQGHDMSKQNFNKYMLRMENISFAHTVGKISEKDPARAFKEVDFLQSTKQPKRE